MPEAAPRPPVRAGAPGPAPGGRIVALADRCVQCGLCLPACPTYALERIETESPRGRIALARAWALALVPPTGPGDAHLDHCLGCRRCEAVCPAGVQFGDLLVEARARQRERRPPGARQRLVEWLVARPGPLGALLALYRAAWPVLPAAARRLPRPPATAGPGAAHQRRTVARRGHGNADPAGAAAALFVGCVAMAYEPPARAALARLCAAVGVELAIPARQGCCGALHAHAGDTATAARLAGANARAFARSGTVLTLASGCHDALARSLPPGRTHDALAYLAARADALRLRECRERVALHVPCTQRSVTGSDAALRTLLAGIPGLEVVELDADPATRGMGCCGAAGSAMATDPGRAAAFRAPLLAQLEASGATRLLSANIGCRLHLANGTRLPVQHPLELLAECLADDAPSASIG